MQLLFIFPYLFVLSLSLKFLFLFFMLLKELFLICVECNTSPHPCMRSHHFFLHVISLLRYYSLSWFRISFLLIYICPYVVYSHAPLCLLELHLLRSWPASIYLNPCPAFYTIIFQDLWVGYCRQCNLGYLEIFQFLDHVSVNLVKMVCVHSSVLHVMGVSRVFSFSKHLGAASKL